MTEYTAKTFTLGKSVVVTLPKGLGIPSGTKLKISPQKDNLQIKQVKAPPKSTYPKKLLDIKGDWFNASDWTKIRQQLSRRINRT